MSVYRRDKNPKTEPSIYERLFVELGREPTKLEQMAEVQAIIDRCTKKK